ncbi:MAG: amidohydrolase [Planctomycetales bacterium]|nr:amidohydrolase [Planctomycetales bacterium]
MSNRTTLPSRTRRTILLVSTVHTLDPRRPQGEALLLEDGRVSAVGNRDEAEAWRRRDDRVLDCGDAVAVPGLTDAHLHLVGYALDRERVDLRGIRDPSEGAARVARAARDLPPDAWVVGRGWDKNRFESPRWPRAADLAGAAGGRPTVLSSVDGHAVWANAEALAAGGVGPQTPDPAGGRWVRDAQGRPDGVALEAAADRLRAAVPLPPLPSLGAAVRRACESLAALGLTEVHTPDGSRDLRPALAAVAADGPLPIRVVVHVARDELDAAETLGAAAGLGDGRLRLGGLKIYADGALGPQTAALLDPYEGNPGNRGVEVVAPAELRELVARAAEAGLPPVVHAIGDRAVRSALDAVEALGTARRARLRSPARIEHAQLVHPDDLPRFAALGVVASMQPLQIPLDVPVAERHWGAARCARAYPFRSLARAGATLAFGSDAPVVPPDPGLGLRAAVARLPDGGDRPWHPAESLAAVEALAAYTRGGAAAAGEPDRGVLRPGARADVTLLSPDPLAVAPGDLGTVRAVLTLVAGEIAAGAL